MNTVILKQRYVRWSENRVFGANLIFIAGNQLIFL